MRVTDKTERDRRDASAANYKWGDGEWMASRAVRNGLRAPISIYQVDLGSWRRVPEEADRRLTYAEIAPLLAGYLQRMNFTHVEFLFAEGITPAGRDSQAFMHLVDVLHQRGIGVIAHCPTTIVRDPNVPALAFYHLDGLCVGTVESLLYLDYGLEPGEWKPNEHGGRENLEALAQIRRFNEEVYRAHPDVQTIAEESTAWPMVSRPTYAGGLGFGMKWDVGWTHDTLAYFRKDPVHRRFHHGLLSFRGMYMFNENYVLPLPSDRARTSSLYEQMPGDEWRKFANLRLLYGYMYSQPGKKLLFMGDEFGQRAAWNPAHSLDWHLTSEPLHAGLQRWVEDLNRFYREHPALYADDFSAGGFEWIDANDAEKSILSYMRKGPSSANSARQGAASESIVVVCNFTPAPRYNYRVGVPRGGRWREAMNGDATLYGGSGQGNLGGVEAAPVPAHGRPSSLVLTLPPLAAVFFVPE